MVRRSEYRINTKAIKLNKESLNSNSNRKPNLAEKSKHLLLLHKSTCGSISREDCPIPANLVIIMTIPGAFSQVKACLHEHCEEGVGLTITMEHALPTYFYKRLV